ncbi:Protein N-acetyltransferase, RimJ/RimL family [Lentzea albidocapillata subsp. violacea]|uniref:Protein N-acetyltransferase, RimJ/RimL family n=1 Tax=Lentzea albidocapillata subsp. violacea TaxID=128104 RepID=A0A1G8RHM6_9PSEU|nr:GNAT family N-acetyltransferase [Lentzea albidocapillata]SDJ16429.1 Protein N-acetyltransferase, RimJ/RimL family [Lentzea albidocapillata subsp. violacea]
MISEVALRGVEDADLDILFEFMRDPEAVRMAAFTAEDPDDREAFDAHWRKIRGNPETLNQVILGDGVVVGSIASFVMEGDTEITYWVDRAVWGQGVAGRAVALLLGQVTVRPLHARVASDNAASMRVLTRAGFKPVGTDIGYAAARKSEIEETILILS